MFTITITAAGGGDFVHYETAATAPTMADRVTEPHKEYPTTHFRLDVKSHAASPTDPPPRPFTFG